MATRNDILEGGISPMTWNGTYGLVPVRKRVDLAAIIAEGGAIATGDVFNLFTMPANFKPVQSSLVVIKPNTTAGALTVALGASTYGLTTARSIASTVAAGTTYDNVPAAETVLAAETTAAVTITGTIAEDAVFEVVIMGFWMGPLPGYDS